MSRANSLGGGMATGLPLLKANVYAAQLKAAPEPAYARSSAVEPAQVPVVVKNDSKSAAPTTKAAPKRKVVVKVNPKLAKLLKGKPKTK